MHISNEIQGTNIKDCDNCESFKYYRKNQLNWTTLSYGHVSKNRLKRQNLKLETYYISKCQFIFLDF